MNLLKRFSKKQETEAVEVPVRESGTALAQQNALRIAMTLVRSDFLEYLVTTKGLDEAAAEVLLSHTEFDVSADSVMLLVLRIDNFELLPRISAELGQQYSIEKYADIVQGFSDCISKNHGDQIYGRSQNDFLCLVGFHQNAVSYGCLTENLSLEAKRIIEEKINPRGIQARFAISRCVQGFSNVGNLYQDIGAIFDYSRFIESRETVLRADRYIPEQAAEETDFPDIRRLRATIQISVQQCIFEHVKEMIEEFLQLQFADIRCMSPQSFRIAIFQYLTNFMKACDEALLSAGAKRLQSELYFTRLQSIETLEEYRDMLYQILDEVMTKCRNSRPQSEAKWIATAIRYISENYMNPDMNASAVADHLDMSLSHVTRTFTSAYGCGLFEYIQRFRVGKAMQLLRTGLTVQEIAANTGFPSVPAMNRAFKKHRGITPSHMNSQSEFKK